MVVGSLPRERCCTSVALHRTVLQLHSTSDYRPTFPLKSQMSIYYLLDRFEQQAQATQASQAALKHATEELTSSTPSDEQLCQSFGTA